MRHVTARQSEDGRGPRSAGREDREAMATESDSRRMRPALCSLSVKTVHHAMRRRPHAGYLTSSLTIEIAVLAAPAATRGAPKQMNERSGNSPT